MVYYEAVKDLQRNQLNIISGWLYQITKWRLKYVYYH